MNLLQKFNSFIRFIALLFLVGVSSSAYAVNYSLDFDGTDDYLEVPYNSSLNPSKFTISSWAKVEGGSDYRSVITSRLDSGGTTGGYMIYAGNDDKWRFWTGKGAGGEWNKLNTDISVGTDWTFLTATYDGTNMKLYVNDTLAGTLPASAASNTSEILRIGAGHIESSAPLYNFDGKIDEVSIWNEALTVTEVTALYNSGTPLSTSSDSGNYASSANLQAYYKMNTGSGSVAIDSEDSGTDYDGSITGATWTAFSTTQSTNSVSITEGGSAGTYTLVLDQQPTSDVTVTLTSSDTGAATATSSLTFTTSNWNTPQTVTVSPVDDADATNETVTISHSLSGGGYTDASVTNVTVTVTDDDTQALTLSAASATIGEAASSTYTVKLATQPTGTVTVALASNDTTAAAVSPSSLTFTTSNWNSVQTVTVSGVNDNDATGETVTISNTASGGDYGSVLSNYTATMTDDDAVGITQSATSGTIGEAGTGTYTVVLNTQPTSTVTVTPSSSDTDAATVSGALTFTTGNWNVAQTITITGVNDADESNESVAISHTISGGDYSSVTMTNYTASITDDDDLTAPTNQNTVFASAASASGGGTVTIVSSGDTTNNVWFAPAGTTTFTAGATMTKATNGVATSILAPATDGTYYLYVLDAAGNISTASTAALTVSSALPSPLDKTDVTASIKAMSGVAIDTVQMNFTAVDHRIAWLNSNISSNKLSHQGVRLSFANPTIDKLMNTAYVEPGKLSPTNKLLELLRNNLSDGTPDIMAMTEDTKAQLNSAAFNEAAKLREETIGKVLNATGGSVMGDWNVWTEGRITVGKTYSTDTTSEQDSQTQNISLGFDRIIKDDNQSLESAGHIVGVVLGIGKSDADTTNNSTVDADSYSISTYGAIRQDDKELVQAQIGYGHIKVDKTRIDGSDTLTGSHNANQFFTSLMVKRETMSVGSFSLSPYGKIQASRTWYDGYSESGGATALTYGEQTIDSTVLSAGVDVDYMIPIHKGNIRPFAKFEYGADVSGSSTVNMHYNNEVTNYQLQLDNKADSNWKFVLGADMYTKEEWDSSISYERTEAVDAGYSDSLAVKVGLKF